MNRPASAQLLSPKYCGGRKVIHRLALFVAAVAVTGQGIRDICDQRSINHRLAADIDIILSSLRKNTESVLRKCHLPRLLLFVAAFRDTR